MKKTNQSLVSEFLLLGLSRQPQQQQPLFLLFLIMYLATVLGNLLIILVVSADSHLHTPMYFFLFNLSMADICFIPTTVPKMVANVQTHRKEIFYVSCLTQMSLLILSGCMDAMILTVMAYDRFVAICNPLLYTVAMSQSLCAMLVGGSYAWDVTCSLFLTCSVLNLSFHGFNLINHFCCEFSSLLSLSCSDTYVNQMLLFIFATFNEVSTLLIILLSYLFIAVTILKMNSATGRSKAFSTCASHLTTITLFYGTILFLYSVPNSKNSKLIFKVASVFYTVVIPMLNPLIYSLRNKDVKNTVRKVINIKFIGFPISS